MISFNVIKWKLWAWILSIQRYFKSKYKNIWQIKRFFYTQFAAILFFISNSFQKKNKLNKRINRKMEWTKIWNYYLLKSEFDPKRHQNSQVMEFNGIEVNKLFAFRHSIGFIGMTSLCDNLYHANVWIKENTLPNSYTIHYFDYLHRDKMLVWTWEVGVDLELIDYCLCMVLGTNQSKSWLRKSGRLAAAQILDVGILEVEIWPAVNLNDLKNCCKQ